MVKNPLDDGTPRESRKDWTLKQHCDHANAQLILKGTNDERTKGLGSVRWIVRGGRVVLDFEKQLLLTKD